MSRWTTRAPVSVVIPCYNCRETIERAVQSVAAQTLLPHEIILIDDGSTEDSIKTMANLAKSYPAEWIRIIEFRENRGPSAARNLGWEAAASPYIAFLDADDRWHPKKLEIQYASMSATPLASVIGHDRIFLQADEVWPDIPLPWPRIRIGPQTLLYGNPLPTSSIMLRSKEALRFKEGKRYGEDYDLWLRLAFSEREIYVLKIPLACRHKASFGASGLSNHLLSMEKGEIESYLHLFREGKIGSGRLAVATLWSLIRFLRRIVLSRLRRSARKDKAKWRAVRSSQ